MPQNSHTVREIIAFWVPWCILVSILFVQAYYVDIWRNERLDDIENKLREPRWSLNDMSDWVEVTEQINKQWQGADPEEVNGNPHNK